MFFIFNNCKIIRHIVFYFLHKFFKKGRVKKKQTILRLEVKIKIQYIFSNQSHNTWRENVKLWNTYFIQ